MQKWEYMWIYVTHEKGKHSFVANGEKLDVQTYQDALNLVGKNGWELVTAIPPTPTSTPTSTFPQFCLKRAVED